MSATISNWRLTTRCAGTKWSCKSRARSRARVAKARAPEGNDGWTTCSVCRGRGEMLYQQGFLTIRRTCSQCNGSGKLLRKPCHQCKGDAFIQTTRKLKVKIPAGVDTGMKMRVPGEGQPGVNGGPQGDLYVFLTVPAAPDLRASRGRFTLHRAAQRSPGCARNRDQNRDAGRREKAESPRRRAVRRDAAPARQRRPAR